MFREIKKKLLTVYDESEAHSLALIVMEEIGGISMTKDLVEEYPLSESVKRAVERLLEHEPIQYVTGITPFCGMKIKCDRRALIPRPETEWMVKRLIATIKSNVSRILDLGSGTGCIALALAKAFPKAEVTGVDISPQAVALSRENALINGITNVNFIEGDMTELSINGKFDIIISNPPYITIAEEKEMRKNVLDWEPHNALFVPDGDELLFHRSIVDYSKSHLTPQGVVIMEINEHLAEKTRALTENGIIINDQFGKPRFIEYHG